MDPHVVMRGSLLLAVGGNVRALEESGRMSGVAPIKPEDGDISDRASACSYLWLGGVGQEAFEYTGGHLLMPATMAVAELQVSRSCDPTFADAFISGISTAANAQLIGRWCGSQLWPRSGFLRSRSFRVCAMASTKFARFKIYDARSPFRPAYSC